VKGKQGMTNSQQKVNKTSPVQPGIVQSMHGTNKGAIAAEDVKDSVIMLIFFVDVQQVSQDC
jgi:hypothetical protein